ncbi:MAG: hypothetical protein P1V97_16150 [Planctomycetota bacterium]|nr:hypothetical protein [Planctomycetota bacterium]
MKFYLSILLSTLLFNLACTPPPMRPTKINGRKIGDPTQQVDDKPRKALPTLKVTDGVLKALRAYMYAYYDFHLFRDGYRMKDGVLQGPLKNPPKDLPVKVVEREKAARQALGKLMGAEIDRPAVDLLEHFFKSMASRKELLIIPNAVEPSISSIHLVKCKEKAGTEDAQRELTLFDKKLSFQSLAFDEVIVENFLTYKSRRMGLRSFQAVFIVGDRFYVNRAAIKTLGFEGYWQRLEYYAKVEAAMAKDATFIELAKKPVNMLELAKDGLRSISLQPLSLNYGNRTTSVKLKAFFNDYVARAELRAATELFELRRFKAAKKRLPTNSKERRWLAELAFYNAMIHGDPRGVLATIFGLAAQQYSQKRALSPQHVAAFAITVALKNVNKEELKKDAQLTVEKRDALALSRLCRTSPKELKALAKAKYEARRQKSP